MLPLPPFSATVALLPLLLAICLVFGLVKLRLNRSKFTALQKAGLEFPDHSFWWGHLANIDNIMKKLPKGADTGYGISILAKDFPNGLFYLDTWPFVEPLLVVATPTAANALQKHNAALNKPDDVQRPFDILCAGPSMLTMQEHTWKPWRALFNPSFSSGYILQLAPSIAKEVGIFCGIMRQKVSEGANFPMEKFTAQLTLDIIGKTTLDTSLSYQQNDNALARTLQRQVEWITFSGIVEPWKHLNPLRPLIQWDNNRRLRKYIGDELEKRFAEARATSTRNKGAKSIVSLALENYIAAAGKDDGLRKVDEGFKSTLTSQIILFMFAGHETTSSTLCFCYYYLATHPNALDRIRAEHDEVFGTDISITHVTNTIEHSPERLNQLPYTLAVIKETLRLCPPAAGIRIGSPAVTLVDDSGKQFPTAGFKIWTPHIALHRNPKYWKDPHSFIPERWLAKEGDPLYPTKGAWRPFEAGARSCIGQALALMETRVVLLMTLREFDFEPALGDIEGEVFGSKAWTMEAKGVGGTPNQGCPVRARYSQRARDSGKS